MNPPPRNGLTVAKNVAVLIGLIAAAAWALEARYAKSADFDTHKRDDIAQYQALQLSILESRHQAIRRDAFPFEELARKRGLSSLSESERAYLNALHEQDEAVTNAIETLKRRGAP